MCVVQQAVDGQALLGGAGENAALAVVQARRGDNQALLADQCTGATVEQVAAYFHLHCAVAAGQGALIAVVEAAQLRLQALPTR
ncbi:hypothetical protein D3C77_138890 [compost metagenome]